MSRAVSGATSALGVPGAGASRHAGAINLTSLLAMRRAAFVGHVVIVAGAHLLLPLDLPLVALGVIIALEAVTNPLAGWLAASRPTGHGLLFGLMTVDLAALGAMFYFTGGPSNPFNVLFLANISLSAVVLPVRHTAALVVLSAALFGLLFEFHHPLPGLGHHDHGHAGHGTDPMSLHLRGMWVAFALAAAFIAYFVTRVREALAQRDAALQAAEVAGERSRRLASLATLAAGAAHELGTPLGTIAVAARELERELESAQGAESADWRADARLIRAEVERCRAVLGQLSSDAGQSTGEMLAPMSAAALLDRAVQALSEGRRVAVRADDAARSVQVVGAGAVERALRCVLENALKAQPTGVVDVRAVIDGPWLRLSVQDRGEGMSGDVLAHATEPFFTTRESGDGMGLGLFLATSAAEQLGGDLTLDSRPGVGTTVTIRLPATSA